ncbi:DUF2779 domain-containing protein [Haloplasma contractile]|uniref:DUF2779 domain-containing protein n=1 Tax=Haloplasma contractile SSD-17B TaxID=1033810 RepID=U2EAR6_9MOLU|nr:DUF2779 domain-containing protein [Haloplasma contractile]ERJ11911.1 Domain of unknown protein [Haloplasma contractile SSD-17B]
MKSIKVKESNFLDLTRCKNYILFNNTKKIISKPDEYAKLMHRYKQEIDSYALDYITETYKCTTKYFMSDTINTTFNNVSIRCNVNMHHITDDGVLRIFHLVSSTDSEFMKLNFKCKEKEKKILIFDTIDHTLVLKDTLAGFKYSDFIPEVKYEKQRSKLLDQYQATGRMATILAYKRNVIEEYLKNNDQYDKVNDIEYYVVALNNSYTYDRTVVNENKVYGTDSNGNELFTIIDLTKITEELQPKIEANLNEIRVNGNITSKDPVNYSEHCGYKKIYKCEFCSECWPQLHHANTLYSYIDYQHGFKNRAGNKYNVYDLINDGKFTMLDIPSTWLHRRNNQIQRDVVEREVPYVHVDKIKKAIALLTYPIYHLDFETFPCPLPRFKGESPYTQSVFQFSLHIEENPDSDLVHVDYLADDHTDHRENIIKLLINHIDVNSNGTILAYNKSFEKGVLDQLASVFPEYSSELNKMSGMLFDLIDIVKTNQALYKELGFSDEDAKTVNYYHPDLNGSYSIKAVLPLFSNLSYKDLQVQNGMEAVIAYANFEKLSDQEKAEKLKELCKYCKQDTFAMVEVLWGLKGLVK